MRVRPIAEIVDGLRQDIEACEDFMFDLADTRDVCLSKMANPDLAGAHEGGRAQSGRERDLAGARLLRHADRWFKLKSLLDRAEDAERLKERRDRTADRLLEGRSRGKALLAAAQLASDCEDPRGWPRKRLPDLIRR